ncbi:hypothetical protein BDQ17DRAFT_1369129 [Cyathus striatus]|nr:hypothetical protein BDQ17DRAFT_1369129 [Cyathus striatus]
MAIHRKRNQPGRRAAHPHVHALFDNDDDNDGPYSQNASTNALRFALHKAARSHSQHVANESISSIDMREIMQQNDWDDADDDPTATHTLPDLIAPPGGRPSTSSTASPLPSSTPSSPLLALTAPASIPMRMRQISIADPIDPEGILGRSSVDVEVGRERVSKQNPASDPQFAFSTRTPTSAGSGDAATPTSASTITPAPDSVSHPMSTPTVTSDDVSPSNSISPHPSNSTPSTTPPPVDPQSLHLRMRAVRSRSESHKQALHARSTSPNRARATTVPSVIPVPPVPSMPDPSKKEEEGRASPDIDAILARTPRPVLRRKSQAQLGKSSRSQSRTRARVVSGTSSGDTQAGVLSRSSAGWGVTNRSGDEDLDYIVSGLWRKSGTGGGASDDEDYGVPIQNGQNQWDDNEEGIRKLERELDGEGSDSDSSIDLHTLSRMPLASDATTRLAFAQLEAFASSQSRAGTPQDGRPGSGLSMSSVGGASLMTKSGIFKDNRDTPQRRTRHRDGKLLRGGIGLTTGLGWSDSEDEDAPSPLTRRLSALSLSRRSSASSVVTTPRAHPLSRSFSSGILSEEFDNSAFQMGGTGKSRSPLPPTSWKKSGGAIRESTGSNGSSNGVDSLTATRTPKAKMKMQRPGVDVHNVGNKSASSLSIPLPVTPSDDSQKRVPIDKDKSLPPLPVSVLKKYPSNLSLRSRTVSAGSNVSGIPTTSSGLPTPSGLPTSSTSSAPIVRPLRLPRQTSRSTTRGDRPAVPVPSVGSGLSAPQSAPTTPTLSSSIAKPKPRTGTGMVYRTSSGPASRMRTPMSLSASLSASTGSLPPRTLRPTTPSTRGVAF